jgi:hypothetical protein
MRNPAASGTTWTTVFTAAANATEGGWDNFTLRTNIPAANLTDMSGTQMRITLTVPGSTTLAQDAAYMQSKGSATFDFSTSPTQIFWNGGSASFSIFGTGGSQVEIVSDPFSFSYDGTHDLVFSFYGNPSASSNAFRGNNTVSGPSDAYKSGNDASTTVASGYTNDATLNTVINKIEVA